MATEESEGLRNGRLWLTRARQDYAAFKRLVPLTRNNYRTVRVSDPALAVYLLQQAHEKAAKAVALASGRYGEKDVKKKFGHRSPAALLDFLGRQVDLLVTLGMGPLMDLSGTPSNEQASQLKSALAHLPSWEKELARESPSNVLAVLDMLLAIRERACLGTLRRVWGPHSSVVLSPSQSLVSGEPPDLVTQMEEFWMGYLGQPSLQAEWKSALRTFVDSLRDKGLLDDAMLKPGRTVVHRNAETILQSWAVVALVLLSSLTWPHEATARYPRWEGDRGGLGRRLGAQDHGSDIGIVAHLGYAGYLTGLVLPHLDGVMENTAALFGQAGST